MGEAEENESREYGVSVGFGKKGSPPCLEVYSKSHFVSSGEWSSSLSSSPVESYLFNGLWITIGTKNSDTKFLKRAFDLIIKNLSNSSFTIEAFADNLAISRSLLNKKIVSLTGEAPRDFVRRIRLRKAAELIEKKFGNLSEIALETGFNNPAYFSECFKKQFGCTPSQYQKNNGEN